MTGVILFLAVSLALLCVLCVFLQITLSHAGKNKTSPYRLGVAGFALILFGTVTLQFETVLQVHWSTISDLTVRAKQAMLENFGWLLIISGLIFLFILFCTSMARTSSKGNGKPENAVGEFLR